MHDVPVAREGISGDMQPTCSFMTSPHAGAPTSPVPTFFALLSSEPVKQRWCALARVTCAAMRAKPQWLI